MTFPQTVHITDVGPRDGLQNESTPIAAADKLALIDHLLQAGVQHFEATSFVSPKWVPQMADAAEVMQGLKSPQRQAALRDVCVSVLTPNMKGLEGALARGAQEVVVFGAASEAFSQRNINCDIATSIERFAPVVEAAHAAGVATRGAISCAVGCPYEGDIAPSQVGHVAALMRDIGVQRIAVADTIGVGTPRAVQAAMAAALQHYDLSSVAGHLSTKLCHLDLGIDSGNYTSKILGSFACQFLNNFIVYILTRICECGYQRLLGSCF